VRLFIDGANFYSTAKTLGFDIDYSACLMNSRVAEHCCARSITTAIIEDQDSLDPPPDRLAGLHGYTVVTKPAKGV